MQFPICVQAFALCRYQYFDSQILFLSSAFIWKRHIPKHLQTGMLINLRGLICGTKMHDANPAAICLDLLLAGPCTHGLLWGRNTYFDLPGYELATCF